MSHVFISYKRDDRSFVDELESRIIEADMEAWSDNKLRAGESWRQKIDEAIEDSFAVVVVMTPEARQSEYVTYEWSFAMGMRIPIIPIMLKKTELHPKLNDLHFLDFTDRYGEPWNELIHRLDEIKSIASPFSIVVPRDATLELKNAVEALSSANSSTRQDGLDVLRSMNNKDAQEALGKAIESPTLDVRIYASWILAEKYRDLRTIPVLLEGMGSDEGFVFGDNINIRSARLLIELGDHTCLPHVIKLLDNRRASMHAQSVLKAMLDESITLLRNAYVNKTINNICKILSVFESNYEKFPTDTEMIETTIELLENDTGCSGNAKVMLFNIIDQSFPNLLNAILTHRVKNTNAVIFPLSGASSEQLKSNKELAIYLIELLDDDSCTDLARKILSKIIDYSRPLLVDVLMSGSINRLDEVLLLLENELDLFRSNEVLIDCLIQLLDNKIASENAKNILSNILDESSPFLLNALINGEIDNLIHIIHIFRLDHWKHVNSDEKLMKCLIEIQLSNNINIEDYLDDLKTLKEPIPTTHMVKLLVETPNNWRIRNILKEIGSFKALAAIEEWEKFYKE